MEQKQLLDVLKTAAHLKSNTRHNWISENRKESIADHSWRIALMAMLLSGEEEFWQVDVNRVIRMCLIHDLGEAFTGDIPSFEKSNADEKTEEEIFHDWVANFPKVSKAEWSSLLDEMEALETVESKIYKALDKLEAVIAHNEADIDTWLPLEYTLQFTYAAEYTKFSSYLEELRKKVDEWTVQKILTERKIRTVAVSACLLGENCKYNGGNNKSEKLLAWLQDKKVIPVCPEVLGGLSIPRIPAEIVDGIVTTKEGKNVHQEFVTGAKKAMEILEKEEIDLVILQSRSPSCGPKEIYDGSFQGKKIKGEGIFAHLLLENGYVMMDIEDFEKFGSAEEEK